VNLAEFRDRYDVAFVASRNNAVGFFGFLSAYRFRSVAAARKLAVRLFWMLRTNTAYPEIARIESSPRDGVVTRS
jgi:hypothetical protein